MMVGVSLLISQDRRGKVTFAKHLPAMSYDHYAAVDMPLWYYKLS